MSTPAVSFEFFPPKNLEGSFRLWDCVNTLAPLDPAFVSVTYGAGGATRKRSATAGRAQRDRLGAAPDRAKVVHQPMLV